MRTARQVVVAAMAMVGVKHVLPQRDGRGRMEAAVTMNMSPRRYQRAARALGVDIGRTERPAICATIRPWDDEDENVCHKVSVQLVPHASTVYIFAQYLGKVTL